MREPTETALREWRYGQAQSERLCAAILHIEQFEGVDPQAPLGGGDGKKDLLCSRRGKRWVAASYFPPTHPSFREIREKFTSDLTGVAANGASAFIFLVNQPLTLGDRSELSGLAGDVETEVYHLERIRGILDSPKGYGVRLEYLRIPMTPEEQLTLWNALNYDLVQKLLDNDSRFARLETKLDLVLRRTSALAADLQSQPSSLAEPLAGAHEVETPVARLSLAMLCWIHRIVTEEGEYPEAMRGRLRSVQVWIGNRDDPSLMLPPPEQVVPLVRDLLEWWTRTYETIGGAEKSEVVPALAKLHHRFLSIHPFLDGNGRVARVLLSEATRELLNMRIGRELIADPSVYFEALRCADAGDLSPLTRLVDASLE